MSGSADNALKTPFGQYANELALKRAEDQIQLLGKALPCSVVSGNGSFVTVRFEIDVGAALPQVRVPVATSQYFRMPLQAGDRGVVLPADAALGGVTGLGGGTATAARQANLAALVFVPLGATSFPAAPDGFAVVYGPNGVVIKNAAGDTTITVTAAGVTIALTGGNVTVTGGDVIADGISLKTHIHSGVQTGGGNSGPPV
jgi:hypothetical protein